MDLGDGLARRDFLRRGGVLGVGGIGLAAGIGGAIPQAFAQAPIAINIINTSGDIGITMQTLMAQQGYARELGLDAKVTNVADGTKIMGALIGGSGDICTASGFSQLFPAIAAGAKVKIVGGALVVPDEGIFTKRADIQEVKDLVGKTVGIGSPGALLHELMVAMLRKRGIDPARVTFVNIGSSAAVFQAVVAGTVDAGPAGSDVFNQQAKFGVHALKDGVFWKDLREFTYQAAYSSDRAIAAKRDGLVRTLAAYVKLYRFVQSPNSKDAFIKARVAALGANSAEEGESQWDFIQQNHPYADNPVLTEDQVNYIQKLNVSLGVQKAILPFDQVTDMSLARDAAKLAG